MEFNGPTIVVALVLLSTIGWLANNWIRAKYGYALDDEFGGKTERSDTEQTKQLKAENAELRELIGRMEKRMQAIETIVTDRGFTVSDEIDALRHQRDAGALLTGLGKIAESKERI